LVLVGSVSVGGGGSDDRNFEEEGSYAGERADLFSCESGRLKNPSIRCVNN